MVDPYQPRLYWSRSGVNIYRNAQNLGDAPRLRDTAAWIVREIAIEDLRDLSDAGGREMFFEGPQACFHTRIRFRSPALDS